MIVVASCAAGFALTGAFNTPEGKTSVLSRMAMPSSTQVYMHEEGWFVMAFYGSADSFEVTRKHYQRGLEARGLQYQSPRSRTDGPAEDSYRKLNSNGQEADECATISDFTGTEWAIVDHAAEVERLRSYPYAQVVMYGRHCGT